RRPFPPPRTMPKVLSNPRIQFVSLTSASRAASRAARGRRAWLGSDAHDLRDAVRVICVSLVDLKRQRRLCMTRVDADDRQLPRPQLVEQPGRELAGF